MFNGHAVTGLVLISVLVTGCFGSKVAKIDSLSPQTRVKPAAVTTQTEAQKLDERVYTVAFSDNTTVLDTGAGIIEGAVEVVFKRDEEGEILRLPSGRPVIKNEDIMLNLARANLQENFARFMRGTVAEGVSVAVAEYLRNYYPEPIVKSFQENVSRIAYTHELPQITEREQVVRGNLLIVRADARPQARKLARTFSFDALELALMNGEFKSARSKAALERAIRSTGL